MATKARIGKRGMYIRIGSKWVLYNKWTTWEAAKERRRRAAFKSTSTETEKCNWW